MIAAGLLGFALGTWQASMVTKDWAFQELLIPQILRGSSLMLCMVPITNAALGTLPPQRLKNASGLFNLMRNLGGAVGLALINTIMNDRMDLHLERLRESVAWGRSAATDTLASMTQAMNSLGSNADLGAIAQLARIVRREAIVMAIGDVFLLLTVLFVAIALLTPLMRKPAAAKLAGGH
jgi:DHA2 family multidrug resistance protein